MTDESKKDATLEEQIEAVYRKHFPMLVHVANRLLENREDAEDTVNNVFAKFGKGPPPKGFIENPPGYLHNAVLNEARNLIKSRTRRGAKERAAYEGNIPAPIVRSRAQEDLHSRVRDAKSQLDLGEVALLVLRYELDYSCKEIAKLLGRTRTGIAMSLARARHEMKNLMLASEKPPQELTELKPTPGETQ